MGDSNVSKYSGKLVVDKSVVDADRDGFLPTGLLIEDATNSAMAKRRKMSNNKGETWVW